MTCLALEDLTDVAAVLGVSGREESGDVAPDESVLRAIVELSRPVKGGGELQHFSRSTSFDVTFYALRCREAR